MSNILDDELVARAEAAEARIAELEESGYKDACNRDDWRERAEAAEARIRVLAEALTAIAELDNTALLTTYRARNIARAALASLPAETTEGPRRVSDAADLPATVDRSTI